MGELEVVSAFSQFFVISPRGDTLVSRDFRGDLPRSTAAAFYRRLTESNYTLEPVSNADGVSFFHVRRQKLTFLLTARGNTSAVFAMEVLARLVAVFKDYCGVVSEPAVAQNFLLLYELLDEMLDAGYAQELRTAPLKRLVYNEPAPLEAAGKSGKTVASRLRAAGNSGKTLSASAANASVLRAGKRQNEIIVDVLERLTVTFSASGAVQRRMVNGEVLMKSFLVGQPDVRLQLSETLRVAPSNGQAPNQSLASAPRVDTIKFHECVNASEFERTRAVVLRPPDGEFAAIQYSVADADFRCPFRVFSSFELDSGNSMASKATLVVRVRADIPRGNHATNVQLLLPLPSATVSAVCSTDSIVRPQQSCIAAGADQAASYDSIKRRAVWHIKKFGGGEEHSLRISLTFAQPQPAVVRRQCGPLSVNFEIPMFSVTGVQVRGLRLAHTTSKKAPNRWVRYITRSDSYTCRL
ncbi:MAG: hypothetical protein MHM6MM_002256 [Cercozoa sp. M6MM]